MTEEMSKDNVLEKGTRVRVKNWYKVSTAKLTGRLGTVVRPIAEWGYIINIDDFPAACDYFRNNVHTKDGWAIPKDKLELAKEEPMLGVGDLVRVATINSSLELLPALGHTGVITKMGELSVLYSEPIHVVRLIDGGPPSPADHYKDQGYLSDGWRVFESELELSEKAANVQLRIRNQEFAHFEYQKPLEHEIIMPEDSPEVFTEKLRSMISSGTVTILSETHDAVNLRMDSRSENEDIQEDKSELPSLSRHSAEQRKCMI